MQEGEYLPFPVQGGMHLYLAVPAMSASADKVFSTAGNVVTKKINRLSPESVKNLENARALTYAGIAVEYSAILRRLRHPTSIIALFYVCDVVLSRCPSPPLALWYFLFECPSSPTGWKYLGSQKNWYLLGLLLLWV